MSIKSASARRVKLEKFIVYFTLGYVILFSINQLVNKNVEFIYYTGVLLLSFGVILTIHRRMHFYPIVLICLSVLGLMHLLGGNFYLGEIRLYDFYFIDGFFKYDNLVHMFGSGIMVMLAYALLHPAIGDDFAKNDFYYILLLVLIGMGLGTINEIIEFIAVLVFDVGQMVGGYTNTLLDLVFNTIGSIIIAIILVKTNIPLVEVRKYGK